MNASAVQINASGQLGVKPSSIRFKTDIRDAKHYDMNQLKVRNFKYISEMTPPSGNVGDEIGLIAEEVVDIFPEFIVYNELNEIFSVNYDAFIPVLIQNIQYLQKQIDELKKIKSMENE
jgi:hypothetical protein